MSTAPIDIVHTRTGRRRTRRLEQLARAAGAAMWLAAIVAVAALIAGHPAAWISVLVVAMLTIGAAALAVLRLREAEHRLDAVIAWLLGR